MSGGRGTVGGTIIGAFVIGILSDGLVMMGVSEFWQMVIKGLVIIAAVVVDQAQRRLQSRAGNAADGKGGMSYDDGRNDDGGGNHPHAEGALIGCGFFAVNHLHAWREIEGADIVALCDRDPERLQRAGDEFGIARRYIDADAMFAKEALDFVDIATTVASHRALVERAAAAACRQSARSRSQRRWTTHGPWWRRARARWR